MRISIIGAGNMGMAIACGLAKDKNIELKVSNPTKGKLETLKRILPDVSVQQITAKLPRGEIL